jgi:hypothetical protein
MRKTILASALAAGLFAASAGPALAAPPEQETIPLVCDNGESFDVTVSGAGSFTPGRIVDGHGVLVPIEFGDFMFRAVLPDGSVIEQSLEDADLKGGGNVANHNPRETLTCTFAETFTLPEYDPEFDLPAGTVVTFGGSVSGYLVGR